jgi:hypothetical protein
MTVDLHLVSTVFNEKDGLDSDVVTGSESKALGVHVQLGPVGGPLGKIPVVSLVILEFMNNIDRCVGWPQLGRFLQ